LATDVKLDQVDGNFIVLEAHVVEAHASDFELVSDDRRKGGGPNRRALVHDFNDGLTVNFSGDYPGGLLLVNVSELIPQKGILVVKGGVTYEVQGESLLHGPTTITVNVDDEFNKLQNQINQLSAQVAALLKK
jgi:hypothetical protein